MIGRAVRRATPGRGSEQSGDDQRGCVGPAKVVWPALKSKRNGPPDMGDPFD